jgi:hypothetical protein
MKNMAVESGKLWIQLNLNLFHSYLRLLRCYEKKELSLAVRFFLHKFTLTYTCDN